MENKTRIKFYSGLDTVGGVVMELVYDDHRIIMEMGSAYNPAFDLYDGSVNVRSSYISDSIWTNDVPRIDGIFDASQIEGTGLKAADKEKKTAVLLTHLHLDHMRNMGLVSDDVDVYLSKSAQILESALEDIGEGVYSVRTHYKDIPEELVFGKIKVKPFILNEDSYKDYSFYIETPDLKLHYTGDVFVYGVYEENIKKEAQFLRDKSIDILVCEGTSFLPSWISELKEKSIYPSLKVNGVISEETMLENAKNEINSFDGVVLFNVYDREICHLKNWLDLAKQTNRTILFEPKTAYILNRFLNSSFNVLIPDTYDKNNCPDYLKQVIANNTVYEKQTVLDNPNQFLVQNSYENLLELLDYRHVNTLYMHHSGMPLGDYDPAFQRMMLILKQSNIAYKHIERWNEGKFFSHAVAHQLMWYIDQVSPKLLIPSHCPNRQLEADSANRPYYLCFNNVSYSYDKESNTLREED